MNDQRSLPVREIIALCRRTDGHRVSGGTSAMRRGAGSTAAVARTAEVESGAVAADSCHGVARAGSLPADERPPRRNLLVATYGYLSRAGLALGFGLLAASCAAWTLACVRFMFPNVVVEPPTRFKVGFPQDLDAGQVDVSHQAERGVWIVRHEYSGQPQIYALRAVCTHLGCIPVWIESEQSFKCPCHGSAFDKVGIHYEGPAPRPLERFAIRVAPDGQLEVDSSRTYQQELGQWSDPSCYVPL
jgi:cytochrome b6-f complex iron-sulfur subunit